MAQIWLTFMAHLFILAHLAHFEPDLKQTDKQTDRHTNRQDLQFIDVIIFTIQSLAIN